MTGVTNNFAGETIAPVFLNRPFETIARAVPGSESSDVQVLTSRMSRGDEAAFRDFHHLYLSRLFRYLLVVTGGQEEIAREALQLAYVRVARHVRRFDSEPAFWNWLAMLARNCAVDEIRRRTRYRSLLTRFFQQRPAGAVLTSSDTDARLEESLQDGLASLPADERSLLERKYFNGETVLGLALELQMTEKAMESHLSRIRRKLKAIVFEKIRNETRL